MKNIPGLLIAFLFIISCNNKPAESKKEEAVNTAADSIAPPKPGGDRDAHGCIPSAGYTWSAVKNKCIRIFEDGTRLNSFRGDEKSAYVVFDDSGKKAEAYIPEVDIPVILAPDPALPHTWVNSEWRLEKETKLVLKKGGAIEFME